ncbi:MAG: TolC family protein [Limisphaerales bacterium]
MKIASPTRARLEAGNWQRIAVRIHKPTIFDIPVTTVSSSIMAKPKILKQALSLPTLLVVMVSFAVAPLGRIIIAGGSADRVSAKKFQRLQHQSSHLKIAEPSAHIPRGEWWQLFGDAELNRLQSLALTNNQNLVAAAARFEQARALMSGARSEFFPQITAGGTPNGDITRQRTSVNQPQSAPPPALRAPTILLPRRCISAGNWIYGGRVRRLSQGAQARFIAAADDGR